MVSVCLFALKNTHCLEATLFLSRKRCNFHVVYLYIYLPEHARGHNIYFYRPCLHTQCIFVRTILGDTTYISTDHACTHNIYLYRPCSGPQHISLGTMLAHATHISMDHAHLKLACLWTCCAANPSIILSGLPIIYIMHWGDGQVCQRLKQAHIFQGTMSMVLTNLCCV